MLVVQECKSTAKNSTLDRRNNYTDFAGWPCIHCINVCTNKRCQLCLLQRAIPFVK